ncbi:MAG: acyloxyacyl hydrolase [Crocinitomicaceae bacterium]|nr:acyloxyacyl hydrolase [Crocinitomicaceae bacterium]
MSFLSFGQRSVDTWVDVRAKVGFLAAHRSSMAHLAKEIAYAGEISYLFQTKGHKAWHKAYKYPSLGVTAFFGSVGNDRVLGHYFGVFSFINFPVARYNKYSLSVRLGCGLGYGTKYYKKNFPEDSATLYNVAIGSSINAQITAAIENKWTLGNHSISATVDFTHFSNGAAKVPNLGLNLPFVSLGYGYKIKSAIDTTEYTHEAYQKKWQFGLVGFASLKEVYPVGGRKYPVLGLNLVVRRFFRPKVAMEISFDFISKQAILAHQPDVKKTQDEIIQLGIFAGYVLPLDKFHFVLGMGVYVRDKYKPEDALYHRVGMRYVFDNGININLVLKSHWARADYVEYGIGYTFRR